MVTDTKFEVLNNNYKRCEGTCEFGLTASTCMFNRYTRNKTEAEEKAVGLFASWCVRQSHQSQK